jgi:hypothetical protein
MKYIIKDNKLYAFDDDMKAAWRWFKANRNHATQLIANAKHSIEPSGSDRARPQLWKDIHWRWFSETF